MPDPTDPLRPHLFTQLQSLLVSVDDLDAFLAEIARVSTRAITAPISCGITVRWDGQLLTVGSSDERSEMLDEIQYHAGSGPCLQSLKTGTIVDSPDTRTETRWPDYTAAAVEAGLRCSLSFPLVVGETTLGALNLYGFERPFLFGDQERRDLELFAAHASGTLRVATRQLKDASLLSQMEEALRSRTVIDQALGIIMAQQRCTAEAAFELLRRQSQNSRRRLRDLSAELITRTTGAPPGPGRPFDGG